VTLSFKPLNGCSLADIYEVFMRAFSDYLQDASHITEYSFRNRAIKNGVDLDRSVGVFSDGMLVGFTLVGIDHFDGNLCAFDAGTGIIKAFRGREIAKAMFDFLAPRLAQLGVEQFILEVLKENTPAIKAYHKAGFQVTRELDSFELIFENASIDLRPDDPVDFHPVSKDDLLSYQAFFDWQPSWENSLSSIQRIPNQVTLIEAQYQGSNAGILVYYPMLNWILCLAVKHAFRRKKIASHLLAYLINSIGDDVKKVRLINVQHSDQGMIQFLMEVGFEYTFDQYEMDLVLNPSRKIQAIGRKDIR
jgi:ribosomal protein S18 acetylase RimI-like enzyme